MKSPFYSYPIACVVLFCVLIAAPVARGQETILHSKPPEKAAGAGSEEALKKAILNFTYGWAHSDKGSNLEVLVFLPDGKGKQSFFNVSWKIISAHDVEIRSMAEPQLGAITLHFSDDYLDYTATDFDGKSPLHGHKINW